MEVMQISNHPSKTLDFRGQQFDYVITVCDLRMP
jgi:hypothetical protein